MDSAMPTSDAFTPGTQVNVYGFVNTDARQMRL